MASTLPRLVPKRLVAGTELSSQLAWFGRLLLGLVQLGLHVEYCHCLLQLIIVLRDRCCHVVRLVTEVALVQAKP